MCSRDLLLLPTLARCTQSASLFFSAHPRVLCSTSSNTCAQFVRLSDMEAVGSFETLVRPSVLVSADDFDKFHNITKERFVRCHSSLCAPLQQLIVSIAPPRSLKNEPMLPEALVRFLLQLEKHMGENGCTSVALIGGRVPSVIPLQFCLSLPRGCSFGHSLPPPPFLPAHYGVSGDFPLLRYSLRRCFDMQAPKNFFWLSSETFLQRKSLPGDLFGAHSRFLSLFCG